MRWTNTTNYVFNPILGATSDKYNQLTVICDGTTYAGLDKYKNIVFAGTGSFVNGPNDTGMQITVNGNKTFTFTKSSFSNVDHYYVQIYTYVGKADGSDRVAVDETIAATEAGSYTTELLDLGFADGTDVTKQVAGHDVLTVGGKDYYRNTIENSWISGGKTEDTIINIYAYDADGYVVSSVVLNRSERW